MVIPSYFSGFHTSFRKKQGSEPSTSPVSLDVNHHFKTAWLWFLLEDAIFPTKIVMVRKMVVGLPKGIV